MDNKPSEEAIKLDQFLKLADVVQSGGEAKQLIRSGVVLLNDMVETRRGRKLRAGDVVIVDNNELIVEIRSDGDDSAEESNPTD